MTDLPQVHTGRWRPHRAGIVNIWRYLDEVFGFHHGRLLLRGANGTGKSKALELLLPYEIDKAVTTARFIWTGTALQQADLPDLTTTPVPAGTLFDS